MKRNILLPTAFIFLFVFVCSSVSYAQIITTVAGTGSATFSGDSGPAIAAGISSPLESCFDKYGNFYFVDQFAHRVRKIDVAGTITTVAGDGTPGSAGDGGPATAAELDAPYCVKADTSGNIYIADQGNDRVRKVNMLSGIITAFAGTGVSGFSGEGGPATAANINNPVSLAIDKFNNVYIACGADNRIRKVSAAGIITTIAGTGVPGFDGDGAPAISALLERPSGLAVDDTGNLYIAELNSIHNRLRKVDMAGIIHTVAGNGSATYSGDGVIATAAAISPNAVAFDAMNNMFITDFHNRRVYKVDVGTHILHTIAGNGTAGDGGDNGPATAATLTRPIGIAVDKCGNPYICDFGSGGTGRRIRKIWENSTHPPVTATITVSPGDSVCTGMTATFTASFAGLGSPYIYTWFRNGIVVASGAANIYSYVPVDDDVVRCTIIYIEQCSGDTIEAFSNDIMMHVLPSTAPTISLTATSPALFGSTVTVNATVANAGNYVIKWMNHGVLFAITTTNVITYVKLAGIDTITAMVTSHSVVGCYDSTTSAAAMVSGIPVAGVNNVGPAEWNVRIYPNPSRSYFEISGLPASGSIAVNAMTGRTVLRKKISNAVENMDISSLTPGIYAVTITDDNGSRVVVKMEKE